MKAQEALSELITCKELISKSPIIKNAIEKEGLKIVPAFYNLATGKVDLLD